MTADRSNFNYFSDLKIFLDAEVQKYSFYFHFISFIILWLSVDTHVPASLLVDCWRIHMCGLWFWLGRLCII